ncbi:MAG TPA: hypothetical protein VOA87_04900 [Thermoanaerobaculia bacterium]|nr:hypothetical protein [Thermoanaerobaculia bacterium]
MADFTLKLLIGQQDLVTIASAGESIVIARGFSDSESNLVWVSFSPGETNFVSWDDLYGLYAAVAPSSGRILPQSTKSGVASGMYYTFGPQAPLFTGPSGGAGAPPAGSYRVFNKLQGSPSMVFGSTLSVTANGIISTCNPATLQVVPLNQFATFTPIDTVYVWLQSGVISGDVVVLPPAEMSLMATSLSTTIRFAGPSTLSYAYSATLGAFVLSS